MPGDRHDRNHPSTFLLAQMADHVDAIHARHGNVGEYKVGVPLERGAETRHAVFRQGDGGTGVLEDKRKQLSRIAVVIDNEYLAMCGHLTDGIVVPPRP